ncbi:MAG: DUF4293 domain-containing protein [Alistipes sp.]
MIQRIQTIYLLVITALIAITLFVPIAYFAGDAAQVDLYAFGLKTPSGETIQPTLYMGILLALACALPFVIVILYKYRLLQLRLCVVEMVLLVGSEVIMAIYYFLGQRFFAEFAHHTQGMKVTIALPLVCLLFAYLAARAIFHDEMLVRSLDRIR